MVSFELNTADQWKEIPFKKLSLRLMCGLLIAGSLTACGGKTSDPGDTGGDPVEEVPVDEVPVDEEPVDEEPVEEEPVDEEPTNPNEPADPTVSDIWDVNSIFAVNIQMSSEDWNMLAQDGRSKYQRQGAPCFPGYTWFTGTVTVNGETAEQVSIRKKGNWSADSNKPALKLDFGKGDFKDRTAQGERRFTLNNNVQDDSLIKQCLSYSVFAEAGVHAPRCNFARVTAQGKNLGIYTHVEDIEKPFLERSFGNKSGNLYENEGDAAFSRTRIAYFDKKTNEDELDRSDLAAVVEAMNADDSNLWSAMNEVINLDNFISFSIMEALLGHSDGYNGHLNNAYIYQNADDGKFYFIPWGTDQTFRSAYILGRDDTPASLYRGSLLMQRLWQSEEFRAAYDTRLREILDTVWNEETIKARAQEMASVVGMNNRELQSIFQFIEARRSKVEAELAGEADRLGKWPAISEASAPPSGCEITEDGTVVVIEPETSF